MKNTLPVESRVFLGLAALAVFAMIAANLAPSPTPPRAQHWVLAAPAHLNPSAETAAPRQNVDPSQPALRALSAPPGAGDSPLDDALLAPDRTAAEDLAVVFNLFTQYRKRFGGYPTGEDNAAFVNALAGNNPARLPLLDRAHPAINAAGELCDRWDTPFTFHLLASDALEVRSAGADGTPYTADDQVIHSEQAGLVQR
jgi:hypothetical protein